MLETKREEINAIFQNCLAGQLEPDHEELGHLGSGVYVTVGEKFPIVDVRHFWKPEDVDKPVATRRSDLKSKQMGKTAGCHGADTGFRSGIYSGSYL